MAAQTSITVEQSWSGDQYGYTVKQTVNTLIVAIGQHLSKAEVAQLISDGHKVTVKLVS